MKILRLQRFSATNLISSVFKERSVQVYNSKHVGLRQPTFISHLFAGAISPSHKLRRESSVVKR
ncbi:MULTISPECIES: hypothetical protein [Bacillus]|uniref:Uncharacterized protein n=2 Tax=Bacillus cereus group TaxID=86661 RepID=A0AAW4QYC5_BACCE|nr:MULTISPECIES: hypothetical protein [Bacillus]MBJ8003387.1 hypothetical protein [Bacillus cereus]MBY0038691.1 hypothetical protein [Bacillus cereus]MED1904061.1 hypothetical protein [Bacillus thuringiensis]HDX9683257.1 hypothetical protein [Bacillus cereus]